MERVRKRKDKVREERRKELMRLENDKDALLMLERKNRLEDFTYSLKEEHDEFVRTVMKVRELSEQDEKKRMG